MPKPRRTPYVNSKGEREKGIYTLTLADGTELFEICWRTDGKLYWRRHEHTEDGASTGRYLTKITQARAERDRVTSRRRRGIKEAANPRLRFGEAADRWLAEQVAELRKSTRDSYTSYVENHLRPRWGNERMDAIDVSDAARLVRELRAEGKAEWTIAGIVQVAQRVFKFAARHCGWYGQNPFALLENGERPKVSETAEPRIYEGAELAQVLAASTEPWTTLFRLAGVAAGRESELLGLWWGDLDLTALDAATIRFGFQVDRQGERVPLKTEESKATLPLPRSSAAMLLEHKARSRHTGPRAFVFATATGRPLGQRNVLRALYRAQRDARTAEGRPTFPELFEHDDHGHLAVDAKGRYVPRNVKRRELSLPDFHALRHTAAMECDDAEEARDLLRHKNSNVTRAIYRAHFGDKRRAMLRAKMEARHGLTDAETTNRPNMAGNPSDEGTNVVAMPRV